MPTEVMRDRYYSNIRSKLSFLVTEIRSDNSVNLQALNIHAENIFAGVLNILYGWSLKNANAEQQNAAGIDLFDADKKIVVQVSSKHTHKKIQEESINKIVNQTVGDGEPTPKYKGYHYYFLAIAEIAKPTKAFTIPNWLTFEPKTDILDLTKLLSDVLNSDIEKQKQLSELLDREMSSDAATQRMKTVAENTPLSKRNPFRYDAETVSFVGREREMQELHSFLDEDAPFKWWGIVGPGGSGKTRLAYELKKELDEDDEWTVEILGENIYHDLEAITNEGLNQRYPHKTLFIADNVQHYSKVLGPIMRRLSSDDLRRAEPIRLLLIGRDYKEDDLYVWEKLIYRAAQRYQNIREKRYDKGCELQPFEIRNTKEAELLQIILSFAESLRISEPSLQALSAEDGQKLCEALGKIDPEKHRPLFALFLTDAYLHYSDAMHWPKERILDYTLDRETSFFENDILNICQETGYNEELIEACLFLWCVSTVLGSLTTEIEWQDVLQNCPDIWAIIQKNTEEYHISDPNVFLERIGLASGGKLIPMTPDLLGEYLILRWVKQNKRQTNRLNSFFHAILQFDQYAYLFFEQLFRDYNTSEDAIQSLLSGVIPGELDLSSQELFWIATIIQTAHAISTNKSTRSELLSLLEYYVTRETFSNSEKAAMLNILAAVYNERGLLQDAEATYQKVINLLENSEVSSKSQISAYSNYGQIIYLRGRYREALVYHKKANRQLEGNEELLSDTEKGLVYNNAAVVYQEIGEWKKAREFYEKALKMMERSADNYSSAYATLKQNLGIICRVEGNFEDSLQYLQESLHLHREIYGIDHPAIGNTLTSIGETYYDMGDISQAKENYEAGLKMITNVYPQDHIYAAGVYHNLSAVFKDEGDYKRAKKYAKMAYDIRRQQLGEDHPDTAASYNNLAIAYFESGDYVIAVDMLRNVLRMAVHELAEDHIAVATTKLNLGKALFLTRQYSQAIPYLLAAKKVFLRYYGPDHPRTREAQRDIFLATTSTNNKQSKKKH